MLLQVGVELPIHLLTISVHFIASHFTFYSRFTYSHHALGHVSHAQGRSRVVHCACIPNLSRAMLQLFLRIWRKVVSIFISTWIGISAVWHTSISGPIFRTTFHNATNGMNEWPWAQSHCAVAFSPHISLLLFALKSLFPRISSRSIPARVISHDTFYENCVSGEKKKIDRISNERERERENERVSCSSRCTSNNIFKFTGINFNLECRPQCITQIYYLRHCR